MNDLNGGGIKMDNQKDLSKLDVSTRVYKALSVCLSIQHDKKIELGSTKIEKSKKVSA